MTFLLLDRNLLEGTTLCNLEPNPELEHRKYSTMKGRRGARKQGERRQQITEWGMFNF